MGPKLIGHHFVPYKGISDMHSLSVPSSSSRQISKPIWTLVAARLLVSLAEIVTVNSKSPEGLSPPRTAPTPRISVSISSPYPNPAIS